MIITLYGPDSYRRKIKLDSLVREYLKKRDTFAFEVFDLTDSADREEEEAAFGKLEEFLRAPSLFQAVKLAVVKNPFSCAAPSRFKKIIKEYLPEGASLIISDHAKSIKKEFIFLKEKPNISQFFNKLEYLPLALFIKEEAKKRGIILSDGALNLLKIASSESWDIINELEKLKFLKAKNPISPLTLGILGVAAKENFFSMVGAWLKRPIRERLLLLEKLAELKEDAAKIFNILAYQDFSKLRLFADYDVLIKSGRLEYDDALLDLALR